MRRSDATRQKALQRGESLFQNVRLLVYVTAFIDSDRGSIDTILTLASLPKSSAILQLLQAGLHISDVPLRRQSHSFITTPEVSNLPLSTTRPTTVAQSLVIPAFPPGCQTPSPLSAPIHPHLLQRPLYDLTLPLVCGSLAEVSKILSNDWVLPKQNEELLIAIEPAESHEFSLLFLSTTGIIRGNLYRHLLVYQEWAVKSQSTLQTLFRQGFWGCYRALQKYAHSINQIHGCTGALAQILRAWGDHDTIDHLFPEYTFAIFSPLPDATRSGSLASVSSRCRDPLAA